jgi:hypothetical protein
VGAVRPVSRLAEYCRSRRPAATNITTAFAYAFPLDPHCQPGSSSKGLLDDTHQNQSGLAYGHAFIVPGAALASLLGH